MITRQQAMDNIVKRATQLSLAKQFAKDYPSPDNWQYAERIQALYNEAYLEYTDPFRSKTHA